MQDKHCNIDNLPSCALTHIASFLTVLDLSVTTEESLAIVGTRCDCDILDFGEIHRDLAAKLTDDHIRDILLKVNAVNRVKRLRLAGCTNITGAGLEPLRGSLVIEQIDLSLVGANESPTLAAEPPISCDHVLPILDSIINQERCALKHLQFPNAWRRERSIDSDFHHFILRYNQMWARRQEVVCCSKCSARLPQRWERDRWRRTWLHDVGGPWISTEENLDGELGWYGVQRYTCLKCVKHYCRDCEIGNICVDCYRVYCTDCLPDEEYGYCGCTKKFCSGCSPQQLDNCRGCDDICCDEERKTCYSCGVTYCEECVIDHWGEDCTPYTFCSTCDDDGACCNNCRVKRTLEGRGNGGTCGKCCQLLVPLLKKHVEELTKDNNQLRDKIKSLRKSDQEGGD
ncbi:hypothetical protein ACHAWC_001452 [Mediolabrus comicus]